MNGDGGGFWNWSLRLFRVRGITVRAHWSLLVIVIFDLVMMTRAGLPLWLAPLLVLILFTSILLHEFGHSLAARAVGGDSRLIVLWMMGGLAECEEPMRPWPKFAVAAAGPLVTAVLAACGWALLYALSDGGGIALYLAGYLMAVNLRMLIFNLIPCFPLDGGRMFLATLWPLIGLRKAMATTIIVSYPCIALLLLWAMWERGPSPYGALAIGLGMWLLSTLVQEHAMLRMGSSVAFGIDLSYGDAPSWLQRTLRRRRQRQEAAREAAEEREQDAVDLLLAKVGESGLASLTRDERATLEAYSRKQRARERL